MRVFGFATDPEAEWTTPFPRSNGVKARLLGGDWCDPIGWVLKAGFPAGTETNWFNANPKHVIRVTTKRRVFPFFSWKLGRLGGYLGWKVYGVDSPAYKDWLPAAEVFDGSRAVCFTIRMSTAL